MRIGVWGTATAAAAIVIAVAFTYQAFSSRPPVFPAGPVASIEIDLEATPTGQDAAKITSAESAKVEAVAAVLRRGKPTTDHKCATTGRVTIHMRGGAMASFGLLPAHDRRYYDFRAPTDDGYNVYRVDREALLRALSALGVEKLAGLANQGSSQ